MKTNLEDIFLIESKFNRKPLSEIDIEKLFPDSNIHVSTNLFERSNQLIVNLDYRFCLHDNQKERKEYLSYNCTYQGKFKLESLENITNDMVDRFGSVNGAAVLFPFVREDLMDRSVKSGFQPILLPLVNFVHIYESKTKEKHKSTE